MPKKISTPTHDVAQRMCRDLPEGYQIEFYFEKGSGEVRLQYEHDTLEVGPQDEETFDECIERFIVMANAADLGTANPMQPIVRDEHGNILFKDNEIVRLLFAQGPFTMNDIIEQCKDVDDLEQFCQLIGFSVSGFGDMSFVRDATRQKADAIASYVPRQKRVESS